MLLSPELNATVNERLLYRHQQPLSECNGSVKHIMVFIKRVYDSTKYPLSQGLDPKECRENYDKQDNQGIVVDGYSMMSAKEKRTKRWMQDQNVYQARYKLTDILSCPQQKKTSSVRGPFLLHFIESICHRKKTDKRWW